MEGSGCSCTQPRGSADTPWAGSTDTPWPRPQACLLLEEGEASPLLPPALFGKPPLPSLRGEPGHGWESEWCGRQRRASELTSLVSRMGPPEPWPKVGSHSLQRTFQTITCAPNPFHALRPSELHFYLLLEQTFFR